MGLGHSYSGSIYFADASLRMLDSWNSQGEIVLFSFLVPFFRANKAGVLWFFHLFCIQVYCQLFQAQLL